MLTVGFCRVDGLVLESISRLSTRRESQLIPGSLVKWWLEVRTSCGLLEQSKDTELAFHNGMFRTGDIGYQDSDSYCYILNPLKDMIVTGGENVYSGEVEAVISKHPAVQEGAVFGIAAPQWVELVAACVVLKPGMALSMEDLIGYCRQFLANYKIPRRVGFSETELPKSGSGTILKRVVRERYWAHQGRAVS